MFNKSTKDYYNDNYVSLSEEDSNDSNDHSNNDSNDHSNDDINDDSNDDIKYKDLKEFKNHGKVWSKEDDKYLLKLVILDYEYTHISNYLERTEDAIKARFVKKILCKKYTKKTLNDNFDLFCKSFNIKRNDMVRYITYVIPSFHLKEPVRNRINFI